MTDEELGRKWAAANWKRPHIGPDRTFAAWWEKDGDADAYDLPVWLNRVVPGELQGELQGEYGTEVGAYAALGAALRQIKAFAESIPS